MIGDTIKPKPIEAGLYETNKVITNPGAKKVKSPQDMLEEEKRKDKAPEESPIRDEEKLFERTSDEDSRDIDLILEGLEEKL